MSSSTTDDDAPKFYDSISDRYDKYYAHDPGLLAFIKSSLERLAPDASVLDIGSGTGIPVSRSITNSGRKLHGIDFSPAMISIARNNVPDGTFELANMLEYIPSEEYDAAFAVFSLFHFEREEMERLVGKLGGMGVEGGEGVGEGGGWLFIGTILAEDMPGTKEEMYDEEKLLAQNIPHKFMGKVGEYLMYTKKGWEKLLGDNGFEIVETQKVEFMPAAECDLEMHFWIMARRVGR